MKIGKKRRLIPQQDSSPEYKKDILIHDPILNVASYIPHVLPFMNLVCLIIEKSAKES